MWSLRWHIATNPDGALRTPSPRGYGASAIDWETSFRVVIIFGIILTWARSQEAKEESVIQRCGTEEGRDEGNHPIHGYLDGVDSLHITSDSGGYGKSRLGLL